MFFRSTRILSLLSVALLSVLGFAAQDESAPVVFEGFVLEPPGAPAVEAVVVTSAGGQAVTDALGRYRLEARVPRDAESVQVTAVSAAGQNRVASARVALPVASRTTRVAPLLLTEGAGCVPRWLPTFGVAPGTDGAVHALAVYDDGGGAALYVGGEFATVNGMAASGIAKWDGSSWSTLGDGVNGAVYALAVHDDGGGAALYAGGDFTTAGGVTAYDLAKWDGSSWSATGAGANAGTYGDVHALAVYDAGGGAALYAGRDFGSATTAPGARRLAKWNGASWTSPGGGVSGASVLALTVYDDGGGDALYVGGEFTAAGGVAASDIAKWDGTSWSALGSGTSGIRVRALTVYDDGGGPALYAGGEFFQAGGVIVRDIAKWDGSSWSPLGSGVNGYGVDSLTVFDDGGGAALYAGGPFGSAGGVSVWNIAKWDGSSWSTLGGMDRYPSALGVYDDGGGAALYAGGDFTAAGPVGANRIAKWNGSSWSALCSGVCGRNGGVLAVTVFDDGAGAALYAGGYFAGGRIAKWNGSHWSRLGSGVSDAVRALAVYDDGGGPALYVGGDFVLAGGKLVYKIAKWNGSKWLPLAGAGLDGSSSQVRALAVYDDGGGEALYVGGYFFSVGRVATNQIAKWDGVRWSPLGGGVSLGNIDALTVHDDGGGAALYAAGSFQMAGSVAANRVAKWDGSSWSALGSGMNDIVRALTVHDDGGGAALYAGGWFTIAGGVAANRIAKWDGSSWSPLGSGTNNVVLALTTHDDGGGAALHVGGAFTTAGGVAANRIAKWDGSGWSPLGSGMNNAVLALTTYDDGRGASLCAGGVFETAFDSGDSYLAKWGCPAPPYATITSVTPLPQPGAGGIRK